MARLAWLGLLLVCTLGRTGVVHADADLWARWTGHDAADTRTIDHSAWTAFLQKYRVMGDDGIARLRYADVSDADRAALQRDIDRLAAIQISGYNRAVQRAYWINLYNALTVDVVLKHYPVKSIRDIDISPGWFSDGPWGAKLVEVEGVKLSLDDIEHRILRPIWKDPRTHYAVNCASLGCPNIRAVAFTASNMDELLDRGARDYVNDPRGAAIVDGDLVVSSIYEWFQADFGGTERGVLAHLRRYANAQTRAMLAGRSGYDDDRYDWTLNGAS